MSYRVAFIGLGVMGFPMAGFISKAGHDVTVYNRTSAKANKWAETFKGNTAPTPADAAKDADFIFTCVGNDNDLKEVTIGSNGAFQNTKRGQFSSIILQLPQRLLENYLILLQKKLWFFRCTVSGGPGVQKMVHLQSWLRNKTDYDKAEPIINCYSKKIKLLGKSGSGQLAKMVNQIVLQVWYKGLSEGLRFGQKCRS